MDCGFITVDKFGCKMYRENDNTTSLYFLDYLDYIYIHTNISHFTSPRYMDMKLVTTKTHKNRKTKLQYNKNV
jgi:hypothetical protein